MLVRDTDLVTYLGKPKFFNDVAERTQLPGVATGMAWTPVGGDILFIETARMPAQKCVWHACIVERPGKRPDETER